MDFRIPWEGWAAIAAWVAAIVAILGLIVTYLTLRWQAKLGAQALRVRAWSGLAQFVDPARYVGAYRVKTQAYLPTSKDAEIAQALASGTDILLLGRGGIGKSHAAVHHIRAFARKRWVRRWQILTLDRMGAAEFTGLGVSRRNYVLFLDDINEYADGSENNIFSIIERVRHLAKDVRVVATLRSTSPALEAVADGTKLFGRFKTIDLEDWDDRQRDELVALTGVSIDHWDGTPLSGKQPSDELRQIYRGLPENQRRLLRVAKVCDLYGLHYCNRDIVWRIAQKSWDNISNEEYLESIRSIDGLGFLKSSGDYIQVYAPYLSFIEILESEAVFYNLRKALFEGDFDEELRIVGHGAYLRTESEIARALLEEYVRRRPEVPAGHYRLGRTLARLNELDAAVGEFQAATNLRPTYYSALYQLAKTYEKLGKVDEAKRANYRARVAQSAETPADLLALAELFQLCGQLQSALELISQSLDKDPDIRHGWGIKGQTLMQMGRPDEAAEAFQEALAREPDAFVYFGLGQIARQKRQWEMAASFFKKSAELYPASGQVHSLYGQALQQMGRTDEAIVALETAVDLGYEPAHFGLGIILKKRKEWQAATDQFAAAFTADPTVALTSSYLGTTLERLGRVDEALEAHRRAVALEPRNKHHHYSYGQALARNGLVADAANAFQTALNIDPNFDLAENGLNALRLGRA